MKVYFGKPDIGEEEVHAISEVIRSKWIGQGAKSQEFENNFSAYVNAEHAKSTNCCTSALHICLHLLNIKKDDEVITSSLTYAATAKAIEWMGATPVLVDIDPLTFNIDASKISNSITKKTKAIVPVHFGGMPCDLSTIYNIAANFDIDVIEDAAHAAGAEFNNTKIGGFGNSLTCFSFHPNKNMTSIEGGMITTSNLEHARNIEKLRLLGFNSNSWNVYSNEKEKYPEVTDSGFRYNMNDINAAVGIVQLKKLPASNQIREKHAAIYDSYLSQLECITIQSRNVSNAQIKHAFHLYAMCMHENQFTCKREQILHELREEGILVGIQYKPVHKHPYFKEIVAYNPDTLNVTEYVGRNIFSLPLGPSYTEQEIIWTAETLTRILKSKLK